MSGGLGTGSGGAFRLPPHLPVALLPLLALIVALDAYCLVDLARARSARGAPKIVWVIIIVFVSAPIGALVYLFAGREPTRHDPAAAVPGQPGPPPPARAALAADDGAAQPPPHGPPILTTSGLTRDYGGTGLFDVDLVVPRGSIYGLVGPNGAGKTTLLSLLSGTRRPGRGTVSLAVARRRIAVCPDLPEFDGWLTAGEVVDLAGRWSRRSRTARTSPPRCGRPGWPTRPAAASAGSPAAWFSGSGWRARWSATRSC